MSMTRSRTVQIRRCTGRADAVFVNSSGAGSLLLMVALPPPSSTARWGAPGCTGSGVKRRSVWKGVRFAARGFPRPVRRLARVGGFSSFSAIPPESSIAGGTIGLAAEVVYNPEQKAEQDTEQKAGDEG